MLTLKSLMGRTGQRHHQVGPGVVYTAGDAAGAMLGVALLCVVAVAGCGGDESEGGGKEDGDAVSDDGGGALDATVNVEVSGDGGKPDGADGVPGADAVVELPKETFWLLYGRRSRFPTGDENDLVLTDKTNPGALENSGTYGIGINPLDHKGKALQVTKYSLKKAGGLSCAFGCVMSQNFKYVAVADGQPSADGKGYTYKLGLVKPNLEVEVGKFGDLKNVADLHFAGDKLYYSQARNCFDTGKCQYEIRLRMMDGSAEEKLLTVMAPDNDPDVLASVKHTTYTGRFQVSEDGKTLVFLTTTIRSVKVWAWRDGNLYKLDYICEHPLDNETCVGDGSQYHDNDEVGISPDGLTVVLFTIVDRSLRVRRYQIASTTASVFSDIVTVPAGAAYKQSVCFALADWQHAEVRSRPTFSADGATVYFVGNSECTSEKEKPWTDILGLEVSKIGKPIGASDILNFTKNPRDNSTANLWIRDLRLSPDKKYFVFNASPRWSTVAGEPASGDRALKDTEAYVMPTQLGAKPVQVTNEVGYHVDRPEAMRPIEAN